MSVVPSTPFRAISVQEALNKLCDSIEPALHTNIVPLAEAVGRLSAVDVVSDVNLPRTHNAAVDGYGVQARVLQAEPEKPFKIVGIARAGHPFSGLLGPDEAIEIYTGATMPDGPDCVAMHEDCQSDGKEVFVNKLLQPGNNTRPPGENLAKGEIVIKKGQKVNAGLIGQLAAAGHPELSVQQLLRVALLSTGDEIIEAGMPLGDGQVYDSNRPMLRALLDDPILTISDGGIVPDDLDSLAVAYDNALVDHDIVISSGGASDGIEDHTQAALRQVGAKCAFWRLAMKPGRPMAIGQLGKKLIFCLPGNPVAAFVCTKLLIIPLLTYLAGGALKPALKFLVPAGFTHAKFPGRAEYLRAIICDNEQGQLIQLHGRKGAGVISSLIGADGLVEIPLDNDGVELGMPLWFIPFSNRGL